MPDLLTHVLAGYILGTILSFRYEWIRPAHVTVVMIGAALPDLAKINLLISRYEVMAVLGIPWDWFALHTLGGTVVTLLLWSLLVGPAYRRRVIALLAVGVASHHVLDALLVTRTGYTYPIFWPLTEYRPPAGNLFHSSDWLPAALSSVIAAALWQLRRRVDRSPAGRTDANTG
ncbi:metal-dependent hydrolase [Natrarchaeobaculum aegyptiacum]|uniref:Metal-dependent hydrolase n=1 Tax=Natrarchaeobaculum aegyptiacum TaxID=745377 RepID=A0A2Z2HWH7_9EURY|nr:metal-dependent hydrolase [Natrarchaeobaculum aegyptiacum]ARS89957.1 metal-dependent hydrolase [Natrarchaeobaculum aegyptiacum]